MTGSDRLDREERQWAERLGELPALAPSADLDRSILQAARSAVQPPRRRRSWHWGGAAAAALALMVSVPQWWPEPVRAPQHEAGPVMRSTEPPTALPEALQLEPMRQAVPDAPAAPPPPPAAVLDRGVLPPSPSSERLRAQRDSAAEFAADAAAGATAEADLREDAQRLRPAAKAASAAAESRAELSAPAPAAAPEDALERVRQLQREQRLDEAREALQQLLRASPDLVVPDDLAPLLDEAPR